MTLQIVQRFYEWRRFSRMMSVHQAHLPIVCTITDAFQPTASISQRRSYHRAAAGPIRIPLLLNRSRPPVCRERRRTARLSPPSLPASSMPGILSES